METAANGEVGSAPKFEEIYIKEEPVDIDLYCQPVEEIKETYVEEENVKLEIAEDHNVHYPFHIKQEETTANGEVGSVSMFEEIDIKGEPVVCSTTYNPTCTRLKQNTGGSNGNTFNETVHQATGCAELEIGAEKSTHSTLSGTYTQGLLSQEDSSLRSRHNCRSMEKEFHELSCSFCLQRFPSKYRLIMHVFSHIDGVQPPAYICKSCGEVFPCNVSLIKHTRVSKGSLLTVDKPYKCIKCGKSFLQLAYLNRHALMHIERKPYKCHSCGRSFNHLGNLKKHTLIHTGMKPHKCEVCSKSFTQASHLKTHALIHTGIKPYKCNSCGKSCTTTSDLKTHTLIHTGIKPYKCDNCGKSFTQLHTLKTHKLIHTGQKPYKCNICGKSFAQLGACKSHTLIHTGMKKPYKCEVCSKSFSRASNLKTHTLIHTGIKPHKCEVCSKTFTQLGNLKKHTMIHIVTKS